jgi:plasmid stabilization system protein ParE
MSCGPRIRPEAEADVTEAALWYNQRQVGLGEKFLTEVDRAVTRVLENPRAFPVIRRRHLVRRALTQSFPYRIFFSVEEGTIVVHAVLHGIGVIAIGRSDCDWLNRGFFW